MKNKRLTMRRLIAIEEALSSRLAGEIDVGNDPENPKPEDYESAFDWVCEEISRRRQ